MSINLARLCCNGAFVLADTHGYLRDGTARKDRKILLFDGKKIAFAIADASDDADSARTLLSTIGSQLASEADNWKAVEKIFKSEMTDWHKAFRKPPATIFTGAFMLKKAKPEIRLYTMEPPRTVSPAQDGYIANGAGFWIANVLHDLLFEANPTAHPQMALRESAYLLYRVDKANVFCRGIDGFFLDAKNQRLVHINSLDIEAAISASFQMDIALNTTTTAMLTPGRWLKNNAAACRNVVLQCDQIRSVIFHDVAGNEIVS